VFYEYEYRNKWEYDLRISLFLTEALAEKVAQVEDHPASKCEVLSSNASNAKNNLKKNWGL
jgi:hypothetical protein